MAHDQQKKKLYFVFAHCNNDNEITQITGYNTDRAQLKAKNAFYRKFTEIRKDNRKNAQFARKGSDFW